MMETVDLVTEVAELRRERDALLAVVKEGDSSPCWYFYQRKAARQRAALDRLNRRVVSQRFVLRTLEGLGRGLTREEYVAERDAEPVSLRDRIDAPAK